MMMSFSRSIGFVFCLHLCGIVLIALFASFTTAQSTLLDFPTPITANELSGAIKARDVGDARVTTYYFWFEGSQGDVFVNVVTKNFAGDIDIFIQSGLKPLTKIVVYPDFGEVETGRVLYLRKPEKLLMRVQGRSPNDDTASFRMKFAGSFVAATGSSEIPELPKVAGESTGPVAVNSVGTILPPPPKPIAKAVETKDVAKAEPTEEAKEEAAKESEKTPVKTAAEGKDVPKLEVVDTDKIPESPIAKTEAKRKAPVRPTRRSTPTAVKKVEPEAKDVPIATDDESAKKTETATKPKAEKKVDPLANVQLVIVFKDGRKIERPLPEVFRFSVDRGVLTVVSKDGRIGRYQMVDVAKVTIE